MLVGYASAVQRGMLASWRRGRVGRTIESTKERKRDTRRKILAEACVLDRAGKDQVSVRQLLKENLDAFLTKPQDRALFDLQPRARTGAPEN